MPVADTQLTYSENLELLKQHNMIFYSVDSEIGKTGSRINWEPKMLKNDKNWIYT